MSVNEKMVQDIVQEVVAKMQISSDVSGKKGVFSDMNEAIEASKKAQKIVAKMSMDQREAIISKIRQKIKENAEILARMGVEETGMGNVGHKILKHQLVAEKTPGTEDITTTAWSGDRIYNFLIAFDKLYDKLSDAEKKEFMGTFVESIELYPERLENGKFLKHIHFRFPVYYNGTVIDDISWENESTVETVVLLSKGAKGPVDLCSARTEVERRLVDSRKVKVDFSLEDMDLSEFKGKATYEQIKAYVLEKTGLKVSSLYIAQIKKKCGLDVGENFNPAKSENARQPQCTPEKEDAIMQAFRHFGII